MRVRAFALATLAAVTGAMAAAYGQVPGQSAPSPAQMTIAGCLKASPNPSGVPDMTTYTLEPIEAVAPTAPASAPGAAAGNASSTAATAGKIATPYSLTSSAAIAFEPHVGHKVEINGHLKELSAGQPDAKAAGEPTLKPSPGGAHNTLEVTALKMVAAVCP